MGSRLSRPSGAEATGVLGRSKGSLGGRSRPEEPPRRLGPGCRLASLLRGSEKRPAGLRKSRPAAPYVRRVRWLREIQAALREHQRERAVQLLRLLRKDLGLEGTFLNDVLYKKATFLNLVDPISHDLLMNLARDLQCPKKEYDPWKSSDRICRQLIYHLSPHSKWHRSGLRHRKSHSSLKSSLQKKLSQEAIHLSGVPLSTHDIQHLASYLQDRGGPLLTLDLSFTDLKDEEMRFLMPFLRSLPNLTHLSLNGNHLTRATVKDLTDAMKDMAKFPSLAWIDLGNNMDVSSMPQPLLVGLRKRLSQQTTLPTIYESLDCTSEASSGPETSLLEEEEEEEEDLQGEEGIPPVAKHRFHQQSCER
ncbi:leucine-rich repeat-containing protein 75B [Pituophis catenifer annectens]|uniref:leucine-rich repeat-containing protein 75B n=1 Tax=Pituophis catenifer annectens TaxID=94852 RepID=UPI003994A591